MKKVKIIGIVFLLFIAVHNVEIAKFLKNHWELFSKYTLSEVRVAVDYFLVVILLIFI